MMQQVPVEFSKVETALVFLGRYHFDNAEDQTVWTRKINDHEVTMTLDEINRCRSTFEIQRTIEEKLLKCLTLA